MKKLFILIILLCSFGLCFAGRGDVYEDPHTGMSDDLLNEIVSYGNQTQSETAVKILSDRERSKLWGILMDNLSEINEASMFFWNGISHAYNRAREDHVVLNLLKRLGELEKKAEEKALQNSQEVQNNANSELAAAEDMTSETGGDPVRLPDGVYEQNETDFSVGNLCKIEVKRKYQSSSKITGSFGYGWETNLDSRIILGIDNIQKLYVAIDALDYYKRELANQLQGLEESMAEHYEVSSVYNAEEEISEKITRVENDLEETDYYKLLALDVEEKARNIYEVNLYLSAQDAYNDLVRYEKEADEFIKEMQMWICEAKEDAQKLDYLKYSISIIEERITDYRNKIQISQERKSRNSRVMFEGSDSSMELTGTDTITFIDENGVPHVLYENQNCWKVQNSRKTFSGSDEILSCEIINQKKSENEFLNTIYENAYYIVNYKNGSKNYYDSYGLFIGKSDVNDNSIFIQRDDSGKILSINNSDCEELAFEYKNNRIVKITNVRLPESFASYDYENNKLISVIDTDGDKVTLSYNNDNRLVSLNKCDGSSIQFNYEILGTNKKTVAVSTVNEENYSEHFNYDVVNNKTVYTNHDGEKTVYYYDEHHRTIKTEFSDGSVIENQYDQNGKIIQKKENGYLIKFEYDRNGNNNKIIYPDGSSEKFNYDDFGNIIYYKNRDDKVHEFLRDENGNLTEYICGGKTVSKLDVNERGQVIKITSYGELPVVTEFLYDSYGNVIEEKTDSSIINYEYDNLNRVIKKIQNGKCLCEFTYENHCVEKLDYNGLKTTIITNGRKDTDAIIKIDTVTGDVHYTRIEYDKRHLPVKIFNGGGNGVFNSKNKFIGEKKSRELIEELKSSEKLTAEYIYSAEGKIISEILPDDSEKKSYVTLLEYENGEIRNYKKFAVSKIISDEDLSEKKIKEFASDAGENIFVQKYEKNILTNGNKILTITDPLGNKNEYSYDVFENLTKIKNPEGEYQEFKYTKAGKLNFEQNIYGGFYEYDYDSDGRMKSFGEENSSEIQNTYFPDGKLKSQKDYYGNLTYCHYDSCGRLSVNENESAKITYAYDLYDRISGISIYDKNLLKYVYHKEISYDENGRKITIIEGGKYKTEYVLDAFGNIVEIIDGNGNEKSFVYDFQNNLNKSYDGYKNITEYKFNVLGNIRSVVYPEGNIVKYDYNHLGLPEKIYDENGIIYSAVYDKSGNVIKENFRGDSEKTYEYDKNGRVVKVLAGGEVIESYSYGAQNKLVIVTDGNGKQYTYNYDSFGRLKNEINRKNYHADYYYDEGGILKSKTDFENYQTNVSYSKSHLVQNVTYSDGSVNKIIYDAVGNIVEIENNFGKTIFEYDEGGHLVLQKDITMNEDISFEYDSAGNRTRVLSSNRDTKYSYGKNNELQKLFDNKQRVSIELNYNKNGKEVLRKFGNGVEEKTLYDKSDRIIAKFQKTDANDILWAEGYVYGADGKRTATINHKGQVTFYEYNSKGQISKIYYPYDSQFVQELKNEAQQNGLPVSAEVSSNKSLTVQQKNQCQQILEKIQPGLSRSITTVQIFIEENYEYDSNGNRNAKITPYGKIEYHYDQENYLTSSGSKNQNLINYSYDKNGNLLQEISSEKIVNYAYDYQNRLIYCESKDETIKKYMQTNYAYDALGRRIIVQDKGENPIRTIYDGLTFDIIKQSSTFENGIFTDSLESGIRYNHNGKPTGDRYRYIDENYVHTEGRYRLLDDDSYSTVSTRYKGSRTFISANGKLAAQTFDNSEINYYGTDLLGSVVETTDAWGTTKRTYSYDAFGNLLSADFCGANDFGYAGKQSDPTSGLYNYGFRDYSPKIARFTTIDPIRDGTNWFSYCNGDSVNFVDLWGLEAGDVGNVYGRVDPNSITGKYVLLSVSKSRGIMDVYVSRDESGQNVIMENSYEVITNVQRENSDNSKASDTTRYQSNGTNPTQVANGIYEITNARAPYSGNGLYGIDNQGLYVNIQQELMVNQRTIVDSLTGEEIENPLYGTYVLDAGYMIHISPLEYTNGCVALKYILGDEESKQAALDIMMHLVDLFEEMSVDGKTYIKYDD